MISMKMSLVGKFYRRRYQNSSLRGAFSLLELVFVIAIIAILISVVGVRYLGKENASGLKASGEIISGLVRQAQSLAKTKKTKVRLIINASLPNKASFDAEKFLRYAGIIYEASPEDGKEDWVAFSNGVYLSEKTYFVPQNPNFSYEEGATSLNYQSDFSFSYPIASAVPDQWYYYEFDMRGNLSDPALILIAKGVLKPVGLQGTLNLVVNNPNLSIGAFFESANQPVFSIEPDGFQAILEEIKSSDEQP